MTFHLAEPGKQAVSVSQTAASSIGGTRAIFLCLLLCVCAATCRERRSDDANCQALDSVVQQHSASLQQQTAQVQALQDRLSQLENALSTATSQLEAVKNSSSSPKQVAFSASISSHHGDLNIGTSAPIRFDKAITNVGQAYHTSSGYFTAPYAGVYGFYLGIGSSNSHTHVSVGIYKGSTLLIETRGDGIGDLYDKGYAFVTTHLNTGEQVYGRHTSGGART